MTVIITKINQEHYCQMFFSSVKVDASKIIFYLVWEQETSNVKMLHQQSVPVIVPLAPGIIGTLHGTLHGTAMMGLLTETELSLNFYSKMAQPNNKSLQ